MKSLIRYINFFDFGSRWLLEVIDKMTALTRQSSKQFFCITCTAQTSSILFSQIKLTNDFETNFDLQTYLWNYLESWLSLYCQIGPKNEVRKTDFFSIFLQFPVHFSNIQDNGRFSWATLITRRLNFWAWHENQISKIVSKTSFFYKSVGGD